MHTDEFVELIDKYSDMIYRICFSSLASKQDAEDALQDTYVRYLTYNPEFTNEEHKKAWLIRVAINICKNKNRFVFKHKQICLEDLIGCGFEVNYDESSVIESVTNLPGKYRFVIYLFYVEEYKVNEISEILNISTSAVKKRLQRGRELLKIEYGKVD